ncbi:putative nucleotidyltransferase component of viral defense system [Rhodothalassium salexigens DSM 2132]|uniref:Putative nucleotidyltransferase component of viral defense system n=1 Tax=Rhodothalassium salexigens DSM 2132 TaxID=1188247 RepID=A0A4V2SNZ1_RHOSA|nr:nucleotidyl transferase AbiEii/AbiGii toxin family protein [Rhodothalassium salexigens]MBB4212183.1 putative nucleotidyltransferase component of viral defense system [Rhodothalassium salexigens DSM 2132]MBK1639974.1 hypothetical protein [Rhodothalassium salexigens DSM 2132]TCP33056.1 putative nucleotidyltransferase component of viral defense system [Rhodothalassium salexigens DSM 2132]
MVDPKANIAASVRDRLKNEARKQGTTLNALLIRFGLERFLYRLGQSPHWDRYLLKGAMLFVSWADMPFRPTQDLDLSAPAPFDPDRVEADIRDICAMAIEPADGLVFQPESLRVDPIREANSYHGFRVRFDWTLGQARISNQIDIGFGDAITPGPVEMDYPALLDMPQAHIRAYPRETVVAEKFEAIVSIGLANSRMKDFYDLWLMSETFEFDGALLLEAVRTTFERRRTALPAEPPAGLQDEFASDPDRTSMWLAFLKRAEMKSAPDFDRVIVRLRDFLMPLGLQNTENLIWQNGSWRNVHL